MPDVAATLRSAWRRRTRQLKAEIQTLKLAWQDPRTPWVARAIMLLVIAYALSPIDLIPDFVPLLGYLDDLLLLSLGIALSLSLIPPDVLAECRARAQIAPAADARWGRAAAGVIVLLWVTLAAAALWWAWQRWA